MASRALRERILVSLFLMLLVPVAIVLVVPWIVIGGPARSLYGRWLEMQWERKWGRQGKRILLVYSRSPNWQSYIETTWIPKVAPHAIVVDWSERAGWPRFAPLEIRAFRYWSGRREFNPLALLFPKHGRVRAIRFWQAFRDFKHGKDRALRAAEAELFDFIDAIRSESDVRDGSPFDRNE
jgi:hypothetical protein